MANVPWASSCSRGNPVDPGRRVAIIGPGGAGKSTLARQLGQLTGLPVVHLDVHYWQPGWLPMEDVAWAARVAALAAEEAWILDGNFGGTMEIRLARADTIIFLDFPRWLCCWRAVHRVLRYHGRTRPDLPYGCPERFDLGFLRWIWSYPRVHRPAIAALLNAQPPEKRVITLRNPRQLHRFLRQLSRARTATA